jgi:hypothetical protein
MTKNTSLNLDDNQTLRIKAIERALQERAIGDIFAGRRKTS